MLNVLLKNSLKLSIYNEKITPTHKSPSLAILLAILIMGAGHLYIGKFGRGAGLFFTAFFFSFLAVFNPFWWIFIVGLYIFAIYDINSSFNGTDNQEKSKNVVGGIVLKIIAILFIIFFAIGALAFFGVLSPDEYLPPEDIKYSLNQEIPVDYLSYKIITAESFTKMGTSVFEKETAGKFIKVYLSITNKAKETKDIFSPRFKIEDSQGRRFDKLSDDMLYISDYIGFGEQLQPGLTVSGAVVFELPNDAEGLNLVIVGDWLSETEAIVNLGNIRSIGQDKTLKEQQDAMLEDLFDY